ncbi:dimethyladenosine transferase 2, mitochondrial isoform X2 [Hyposmocoma kahamanoa]|uniref:dimethyladenosine transferase 2, mitochondrial isoform X2 n=1 Tax=Hyposmocoma kahamanoa TaxID=1477025 RepID=UPI000E6D80E6|nr:dimethyladenosine transferase 2, mitochondrial isoform X2 [Hyposmocoma kahamanoa]
MFAKTFQTATVYATSNPIVLSLRLRHKLNKQNDAKESPKLAADVVNYLNSFPEYEGLIKQLPKSLLKKYKNPESMYLINKKTAKEIAKTIKSSLDKSPVVEKLQDRYPNRVMYKNADFFGMWKLAFQDKMDQGNRIKELLGNLYTENNDRIVKVVGAMPGLSFIKHMITNIVFYNISSQLGRPDLFIAMSGRLFEFLTDADVQMNKHKSTPALFQLLFDYKLLTTVPKVHFLPWTIPAVSKHVNVIDDNCLHLVNITQKQKLPCPPEYLPLLWYFFRPHIFSKSTRVIPMLEQWIPGCGIWLITGQDPPDTRKETSPGPEDAPLPHMTIFTEFGDLNLKQKITVFKKFISWPEFEQCQFRVTMESNLPKSFSQVEEDDKDIIGTHIDDIEHSDTEEIIK